MRTTKLNSSIIIGIIALAMLVNWVKPEGEILAKIVPESWVEGPFNPATENPDFFADAIAGNILYANNGTDLVTYWDEQEQRYFTYNQSNNQMLNQVVFNIDLADENNPYAEYVANNTTERRVKTVMSGGKVAIVVNGQYASIEQLQGMLAEKRLAKR